jgi:hypothetical protein
MKTVSTMKKLVVVGAMALVSVSGSATAFAATATDTSNPDLTVSVSVTPDLLHTGSTATATGSVTNNTSVSQTVTVNNTLVTPTGQTYSEATQTIQVSAGQTAPLGPEQYVIKKSDPRGTYALTVSATDSTGTSSATTHYTVTK